ncbi:hypothetical protein FOA52_013996 [Chlamydomonas sp. UWO 241]|nr:hypothetical protein FOA52_013996 [Chlamydomonas sp. UWO 241]
MCVCAEMSVHQTRAHFKSKCGQLVDNPAIGKDLREQYWMPGNSEMFLDMVEKLTGRPLSADAWVTTLKEPVEQLLESEKADYAAAIKAGPAIPPGTEPDLGMRVILAHGDEVIGDSSDAGLTAACAKFKAWVAVAFPPTDA